MCREQPECAGSRLRRQPAGQVQVEGAERCHPDDQRQLVDRHDHARRIGSVGDRNPHQDRGHQRAERSRHAGANQRESRVQPGSAGAAAVQQARQRQQPGRHPGESADRQPRAEPDRQPLPVQAHQGECQRRRREGQPGAERRFAKATL